MHQLALYMKPIGDSVRETLKKWRTAEYTTKKAKDSK